jgi:hypothetical protein
MSTLVDIRILKFPRAGRLGRSNDMNRRIATVAVLIAAATFGMPTGWCCCVVVANDHGANPAPGQACCRHKTPIGPQAPARPAGCHCSPAEATVPPSVAVASPEAGNALGLPTSPACLGMAACGNRPLSNIENPPAGPPLYLFQCVWRC